ncbi:MAG: serine hydrolase domain-containing protein [Pseudomonadota bacterium]
MQSIDAILSEAVRTGDLPFVVAMTGGASGMTYSGTAGGIEPDAVFRIYSMTKAIGALAAMLLIDRRLIGFDTPVAEILPAWNDLPLLTGWDGETPVLAKPARTATIRHLMTHRSGVEYDTWNADVKRYLALNHIPRSASGDLAALAGHPLTFEPGTRWGYGLSADWLGRVVETVSGHRIDAFCQAEIFNPLAMSDTVFEIDGREDRLAPAYRRTKEGDLSEITLGPPSAPGFYGMGHALYSTAPDYMRFLRMILNKGTLDGVRLLSDAAFTQFCADQMEGLQVQRMISVSPSSSADVDLFPGLPVTHSAGFLRVEADVPGKRRAGSMSWAGLCNTHYWIDPNSDVAAVFMTQLLPFVEPGISRAYDAFERAVYAAAP